MDLEPHIIQLPKIEDIRGNLSFLQCSSQIPFEIKRVYWIYDVPGGGIRGGHAYHQLQEVIIALSGSFDIVLNDGVKQSTYTLSRSYFGLYVPNLVWRQLENFSTNSVALVVANEPYNEHDYIRDFDEFKKYAGK